MRLRRSVALTAFLALPLPSLADDAQKPAEPEAFDPSAITTVSGSVASIERAEEVAPKKPSYRVNLTLKTDSGDVVVRLGPEWYLQRENLKLEVKDALEVTGSRVMVGQVPTFIAVEVRRGKSVVKLREKTGAPAWEAPRKK
jgi:hypothetical protein